MKPLTISICILLALLTGCAKVTYHGLKPISPGILDEVVVSRPTFKWKPSENPQDKYDLVVYESSGAEGHAVPGKTVYYREAIENTEHTLETDLTVGEEYYWSVRCRNGENVTAWSRYDMFASGGMITVTKRNHLFYLFVTTEEEQKERELRNR